MSFTMTPQPPRDYPHDDVASPPLVPHDPRFMNGVSVSGCCSAVSPCSHQQRDPYSICDTCKAAAISILRPPAPNLCEPFPCFATNGELCACVGRCNFEPAPAADPRTKDTNPKDAIGDKKVPLWLCSPIAKAHWAVAQFVGMVKYGAWNWRIAGIRSSIYTSAIQRHIDAYVSGEEVDPIDQTSHLGHIMASAAILIDAKAAGKLNDDRPPSVGLRETYAAVEKQMALVRENYSSMNPKHFTIADTAG